MSPGRPAIVSGYHPGWDITWPYGRGGEEWFAHVFGGVTDGTARVEVKRKRREDSKFYVELEHDPGRRGRYVPSGLSVTKADLWAFAVAKTGIGLVVSTGLLRVAVDRNYGLPAHESDGSCPTRGHLLDVWDLLSASKPGDSGRAQFGDLRYFA